MVADHHRTYADRPHLHDCVATAAAARLRRSGCWCGRGTSRTSGPEPWVRPAQRPATGADGRPASQANESCAVGGCSIRSAEAAQAIAVPTYRQLVPGYRDCRHDAGSVRRTASQVEDQVGTQQTAEDQASPLRRRIVLTSPERSITSPRSVSTKRLPSSAIPTAIPEPSGCHSIGVPRVSHAAR